ncbi:MAG: hypothetical protein CVU44_11135 [Chloroflexi bacterium HGW-Chloroflexi-6]|nr:MAG: hypothetical protein CVU44_11135 [Chloroflexi bacterium HGW-Chloroflexi-6]
MSFDKYNKSDPEVKAANARKGKLTAAENEAALQARIDAVVAKAKAQAEKGPGYDAVMDFRHQHQWRGSKLG